MKGQKKAERNLENSLHLLVLNVKATSINLDLGLVCQFRDNLMNVIIFQHIKHLVVLDNWRVNKELVNNNVQNYLYLGLNHNLTIILEEKLCTSVIRMDIQKDHSLPKLTWILSKQKYSTQIHNLIKSKEFKKDFTKCLFLIKLGELKILYLKKCMSLIIIIGIILDNRKCHKDLIMIGMANIVIQKMNGEEMAKKIARVHFHSRL